MEYDAGSDTRPAVGDDLVGLEQVLRQLLTPAKRPERDVDSAWNMTRNRIKWFDLTPVALGCASIDDRETRINATRQQLVSISEIIRALNSVEGAGSDPLRPTRQLTEPGIDAPSKECRALVSEVT